MKNMSQIQSLAIEIAEILDDNQLGQLSEILDNQPLIFGEFIQVQAAKRLPELFKKEN